MNQKSLSKRLKIIIVGVALCALVFYCAVLPYLCQKLLGAKGISFIIEMVYACISGIPCFIAMFFAFKISSNIGNNHSFTKENAKLLTKISNLAAIDTLYVFIGALLLLFLVSADPMVILLSFVVIFAGLAVSVAAAALSHLVLKAAELQDQSDLTI